MFSGIKFYFHPAKFSKGRLNVFTTQVKNHCGIVVESSEEATYVIVEESCDTLSLPTSLWHEDRVLGSVWLSKCLKEKLVVEFQQFRITKPSLKRLTSSPESAGAGTSESGSNKSPDYDSRGQTSKKYACSQPSLKNSEACNAAVLDQLQKLADVYRARGDQWRAHGYEKAISAIRRHGKEITSFEDVASLEGVGCKMAAKVMEVITTGSLRKVEELCTTEESRVVDLFSNIWGAGPSAAHTWYTKGYRSLEDLIKNGNLTKQQQIGIKYYNEFLDRMSRKEVEEIGQKHRRLDIFVVPQTESACAIMHYTGSALFNRSIRLLAQTKNMHLSEHRLCAGVVRQGKEIVDEGQVLSTPTEESIFKHLDLEYRPPEERDH
ncbi:DNA polymerase lambda-like isoform X2 [Macrosteles quadrilineatus]|uniref:DNA polymerase lambda-like isoform X2 n=1 Tax=Macrosteles quadrilineatus TaxID=74068 RepID=UPI0023E19735|nr:DNA polymerase lambda-like isoform X2 [Macrosteles quadrilineatus]